MTTLCLPPLQVYSFPLNANSVDLVTALSDLSLHSKRNYDWMLKNAKTGKKNSPELKRDTKNREFFHVFLHVNTVNFSILKPSVLNTVKTKYI